MITGGPITTLRFGMFLFCCEKDENRHARAALNELNQIGRRVDWHTGPSKVEQASGFVKKLFGNAKQHSDTKPPTPSQLVIADSTSDNVNEGNPFPELQLKPLPRVGSEDEEGGGSGSPRKGLGGLMRQNALGYQLGVPLHRIVSVDKIEPTMLSIISKDIHSTDEKRPNREAARISFHSSDDRDAVCIDLKVLVEWNKQRQPDVEEELPGDGIRAKAQKAAHFAKREIEMRETKRSREQRKAKFMQGTTGLKYTAMAMATRTADDS
jgi:hypothetical protein